MTTDAAKLALRFHEEVVQAGHFLVVDELFHETCIVTDNNWTLRGSRAVKDFASELRFAFPDFAQVIDETDTTSDGGAVTRWHANATHLGEFRGIGPTGIPVTVWGLSRFTIKNGKIAALWTASTLPDAVEALRGAVTRGE